MDKKNFETLLSGINIVSIAAGMIDIISRTNELEIKPQSIAKFYKISENTVRKNSKNIAAKYNIKLTDKRKKSMRKVSN
jgi:transcription initiation factor TFIIIB Brf1 subunit/transcription initiation factor TFIIB